MMRRAAVMTIAFAVVAAAGAARAQEVSPARPLGLVGQIAPGCIMAAPTVPASQNTTASAISAGSADVIITQLVADDGVPVGAEMTLSLASACNQSHTLSISSLNGGLTNEDAPADAAPFRSLLPYQVAVSWAGQTQTFDSADVAAAFSVDDAAQGALSVTIQIPAGGAPLVAGPYSDQLVLELGVAG